MTGIGLYGKLPASGDFLNRDLPGPLGTALHAVMEHWVAGARERLGGGWLELYLSAPIWRFAGSAGGLAAAGVICPSIDRVGRYFPLALVRPLPAGSALATLLESNGDWFAGLEELALCALEGDSTADDVLAAAAALAPPAVEPLPAAFEPGTGAALLGCVDNAASGFSMPALLEALAQGQNRDYSLWRTSGTEWVPQAQLAVRGWPAARGICALLDGRFAHWGWQTAPAQSITADNP